MGAEEDILEKAEKHSRYAARLFSGDPESKRFVDFGRPFDALEMQSFLEFADIRDEAGLNRALRQLRRGVVLRLICRDLSGLADMLEVVATATALAEVTLRYSLARHDNWMRAQFGMPVGNASGGEQFLHVVGMGKLGGGELNVSSDIDLVFVYPEDGETTGPRVLSCHEYFTRLGRKLIASLNDLTSHGFVFRVDMRLRPYGESGALVSSFSMIEDYFLTQGREWERYAWIKGRAITGNRIEELMKIVRPFVFRKYLDFGAYASMRELHAQIRQQVRRREMNQNIKLGSGGIREIEFIAQVFQLIRGGRDSELQARATLKVLGLLEKKHMLPEGATRELIEAYVFLRNLEHRLQYLDDAQTQTLPENPQDREIIASGMGFPDYASFLDALDARRLRVEFHFGQIFSEPEEDESPRLWQDESDALDRLAGLGFADPSGIFEFLRSLRQSSRYRHLPSASQKNVDELIPSMVKAAAAEAEPDRTLKRMLDLLEAISRRSSYLSLLREYPHLLEQIARLASASQWASDYLRLHPILLDELIDTRTLYSPIDWDMTRSNLDARLLEAEGDTERQMGILRDVRHSTVFQLLVKDLEGLLKLETLSDHLSDLADLILSEVLALCWNGLKGRHSETHAFAIIGYGKLGGRELGYASDLDIIFLYEDDHPGAQETYARLAQRINTWLTSSTSSGVLYETDLRLRPNGASGLLVSSVSAFEAYQLNEAWSWEHQALTRARYVAGSRKVGEDFEAIRTGILRRTRETGKLKSEIRGMRQKMLEGHPNPGPLFDIKHDRGGIVDVEFIVQFLVLGYSQAHPELAANIGNLALLGKMGEIGLIPGELGARVQEAYRNFRRLQHRLRLAGERYARIGHDEVEPDVRAVLRLWKEVFGCV
ncbi:MAG: bifunctional [glutamate--ammonia ligase]-adenylyl-L-tyrosine phosphorylase/[glutamate--ammonia-ligase] adenylyltransferase [Burkholderiales bacterium]|nr:bifunctional [glutamate--ammonia ligase]-adenylyl-L-tyrosine phosphorylase/[glutamate--ammonia-ligase] adenylyltransferase [Burkholderiales bacterium]